MFSRHAILQAKEDTKNDLLSMPNVIGVGIGYKIARQRPTIQMGITVLVHKKLPVAALSPESLIPKRINNIAVDVIEVGDVRALQAPTDRIRPAPGGVSIGHYKVTAGTFGTVVRDRVTGERLILSNNHVLANSNDAVLGDPILQPGSYDGGTQPDDFIAHLERFCEIDFGTQPGICKLASGYAAFGNAIARVLGSKHRIDTLQQDPRAVNQVDAAVARPINDNDIKDEIMGIGVVSGVVEASLGMAVRKSGRTTGFTTGHILLLDATINVNYGNNRVARFENQLISGPMSRGGDSGSLLVSASERKAVGLLFAGSDQVTIFNPIQAVLDCLQVTI